MTDYTEDSFTAETAAGQDLELIEIAITALKNEVNENVF